MKEFVYASVFLTREFVYIRAEDYYHELIPTIDGLHAYTTEPASLEWLGTTLRRALHSARFTNVPEREDWNEAHFEDSKRQAKERSDQETKVIAKQFRLRKEAVLSKALLVWVLWQRELTGNNLQLLATDHRRGGYIPLGGPGTDKCLEMRLESRSDIEIGAALRSMQAKCLLGGKQPFAA